MNKAFLLVILIIFSLGCVQDGGLPLGKQPEINCPAPLMVYAGSCCEDLDADGVCDEQAVQKPAPTTGRLWEIECPETLPAPPGGEGLASGWKKVSVPARENVISKGLRLKKGSASDLFALGSQGTLLRYNSEGAGRFDLMETGTQVSLSDIWYEAWPSYAVGGSDVISVSPVSSSLNVLETPFSDSDAELMAVWGENSEDFYVLGQGAFYHYYRFPPSHPNYNASEPLQWEYLTSPVLASSLSGSGGKQLRDVWVADTKDVYALVGYIGHQLGYHWDGIAWEEKELPTNSLVRGIWGLNTGDIFAVGVAGLVLHYNGVEWTEFNNAGLDMFNSYSDIWGTSHSNLWVVGDYSPSFDASPVCHYDGEYWNCENSKSYAPLSSVVGLSAQKKDLFISNTDGEIFRYYEGSTQEGEEQIYLRASATDGTNTYFGGLEFRGSGESITSHTFIAKYTGGLTKDYLTDYAADIRDMVIKDNKLYVMGMGYDQTDAQNWKQGALVLVRDLETSTDSQFWVIGEDGIHVDPKAIDVDVDGNIYISGRTTGSLGGAEFSGSLESDRPDATYEEVSFDAFVMKFSPSGETQWTRLFGKPNKANHFQQFQIDQY